MKFELLLMLERVFKKDKYIVGRLGYKGFDEKDNQIEKVDFLCNTLEDKYSDFKNGVKDKIAGYTAIPDGKYQVKLTMSNRFKRILPELLAVPYYEGIRIHRGNRAEDTEGCILVGKNDSPGWVSNSTFWETEIINLISQYKTCYINIK